MGYYTQEVVTHVHHWDDKLFSFRCSQPDDLHFENGQFVLIGLLVSGKPLIIREESRISSSLASYTMISICSRWIQ